MKAIIVDDEVYSRSTLRHLLNMYIHDVEVVGEAKNVKEAVNLIHEKDPDLVFLDIEMPGGPGFDLFESFPNPSFHVIFATAYDRFAFKAFKLAALDYLMKPIDPDDLRAAMKKVREADSKTRLEDRINLLLETINQIPKMVAPAPAPPPAPPAEPEPEPEAAAPEAPAAPAAPAEPVRTPKPDKKIVLAGQFHSDIISISEIIYFEADGAYTNVHLKDGRIVVNSRSLKQFEDILEDFAFYRIHKSFLVNLQEIIQVMKTFPFEVVMSNNRKLEVSRRKRDELMAELERVLST
jgi:two-component system LytT family response regulator